MLFFLFLVLDLFVCEAKFGQCFNSSLLKIVDQVGDNYIVRGNFPSKSWVEMSMSDIDYVKEEIYEYALRQGYQEFPYPSNYSFNPVSLESYDFPWIIIEEAFFLTHPNVGKFHLWPLLGNKVNATELSEEERDKELKHVTKMFDKLPERTEKLRDMMETKYDRPAIFYVHCLLGEDRTGELSGAYQMRYLGWTWVDAWGKSILHRVKKSLTYWSLEMNWFCYWLQMTYKKNLLCGEWD